MNQSIHILVLWSRQRNDLTLSLSQNTIVSPGNELSSESRHNLSLNFGLSLHIKGNKVAPPSVGSSGTHESPIIGTKRPGFTLQGRGFISRKRHSRLNPFRYSSSLMGSNCSQFCWRCWSYSLEQCADYHRAAEKDQQALTHTKGQFRVSDFPQQHVAGLWEEAAGGENH